MKYEVYSKQTHLSGIEYYVGIVVDTESKEIVEQSTAMSEQGVHQILQNRIRKLLSTQLH